jgi:hypothetical protein
MVPGSAGTAGCMYMDDQHRCEQEGGHVRPVELPKQVLVTPRCIIEKAWYIIPLSSEKLSSPVQVATVSPRISHDEAL